MCVPALPVADLPTYRAQYATGAIRVDGRLDEDSWRWAAPVGEFRSIYDPGRPVKFPTEAKVLWDATNLYVAFECIDPSPWGTVMNRDGHLWLEEVVEVFLDPDGDGFNYAELEVSPNNIVVDLLCPRPRPDIDDAIRWNIAGLQTAVERSAGGWTAEIAIPWRSLAGTGVSAVPQAGDRWRVGLYRIKRPGGPRQPNTPENEFTAWSLTRAGRGFHDPERFGIVEFVR
jgi:hypothetical protein